MILKQYYLGCLSQASYLIGDESTKTAVIVDPRRDIEEYLEDAEAAGLTIRHVFLTHFHADFLAGHIELRERTGATIHIGARAQAEFDVVPAGEGTPLSFGKVRLEFLETPGHTPEGICILVYDLDENPEQPHAVLTGDTLFIGSVGRPDLMASVGVTADALGSMLYDSIHEKLLALPDATLVYPGHGAGSACGKGLSTDTVSTIGAQREFNYALQPMSREEFVQMVTTDLPPAPRYFAHDAQLNRRERATLDRSLAESLQALSVEEVLSRQNAGAVVLDCRDPEDFAGRHLLGSINIGLGGRYASWAGTVLDPSAAIVLIADPGKEREAALRLGRVGLDQIRGFLDGGMGALADRAELCGSARRETPATLAERLAGPDPPALLDVRAPGEWKEGRIAGASHVPLNELEDRFAEVPREGELVVYCAGGYRSSIAASMLRKAGFSEVSDLRGGFNAWCESTAVAS